MMRVSKRKILSRKGYGKLLLETISTRSDWNIYNLNPTVDTDWTMINDDGSIIAQGTLVGGTTNVLAVDLSVNLGTAKLYLDVDDEGNGITYLKQSSFDTDIGLLDLTILPKIFSLYIRGGHNIPLDIRTNENHNFINFNIYYSDVLNLDHFNNAGSISKYYSLHGNLISEDTFDLLKHKDSLYYFYSYYLTNNAHMNTLDFRLFPQLIYFYNFGVIDGGNCYINNGKLINFYLYNYGDDGVEFPEMYNLETFSTLVNLELGYLKNQTMIDLNVLIKDYMPSLSYIRLLGDTTYINNDLVIESDSLTKIYLYVIYTTLNSLTIQNSPNFNYLKLYAVKNVNTLTIDETSKQNLTQIYFRYNNNLQELDFSGASLTYIYWDDSYFKKIDIRGTNRSDLTYLSSHNYYTDACFIVDSPDDWANDTFRDGDVITSDPDDTNCPT